MPKATITPNANSRESGTWSFGTDQGPDIADPIGIGSDGTITLGAVGAAARDTTIARTAAGIISVGGMVTGSGTIATQSNGSAITGTTAKTLLASGLVVPQGTLAAGVLYEFTAWGVLTTTAGADTFKIECYLGGIAGTQIQTFGTQQPSGSGAVVGVRWYYRIKILCIDATHVTTFGEDGLNFFPSTASGQASVTVSDTGSPQLVLATTASAAGDSITLNGSVCQRLA
jgi:hypothetical protein